MRYWLFQNNQVVGPHDRDELTIVPGFSAESLVCPEGRKGTQMGDWQRAGVVSELAEALLKMSKVPAGVLGGASPGLLPPEPTLRDLALLGSLQEKVTLLESVITQLQEDVRTRDQELANLKIDYELKTKESEALKAQVEEVEKRLAQIDFLKEELAKTQLEEREMANSQLSQAQTISDIKSRFETAQSEMRKQIEDLRIHGAQLQDVEAKPLQAALGPSTPPPAMAPPSEAPAPFGAEAPLQMHPAEKEPKFEPPAMDFQSLGEASAPQAGPDSVPMPVELPNTSVAPLDLPTPGETEPQPLGGFGEIAAPMPMSGATIPAMAPLPGAPAEAAADMVPAAPKKKSKAGLIAVLALLIASAGAGAAYYLGFLDSFLGKTKPPGPPAQAPKAELPMEAPKPPVAETAKTGLPDRSQDAVEFVKSYMPPGAKQSLSERLEGPNPAPGMSPWTVEHAGDARYTVSFYDRASGSKTPRYRFDAQLDAKTVTGFDEQSQGALKAGEAQPSAGPAEKPKAPKGKKRPAPRKEQEGDKEGLLNDPLGSMLMQSSLGEEEGAEKPGQRAKPADESETQLPPEDAYEQPPKPSKKGRKAASEEKPEPAAEEAEETAAEPDQEEAAKPAAKAKKPAAQKGAKTPKRAKDEMTLDELLLPGVPKP
ncbi:MAG: hypothetical protein HY922_10700 [Elusimicrobia bacterium]|nr:hypothetical protein [Elusimicrobiota bacterium]